MPTNRIPRKLFVILKKEERLRSATKDMEESTDDHADDYVLYM
jgi:hypothetical protein